ncbi:hypothetical protein C0993_002406 [Termitomyces sp. T159_Od127]|nr:hypothetical protein C0993_002406 [Termitomyces sp. T159_Od127]
MPDSQPVLEPPQIGTKHAQVLPAKVEALKSTMKVSGVGAKLGGKGLQCYNCGRSGHFAKDCYVLPKVQVRAAYTAVAPSEHDLVSYVKEDPKELVKDEEGELVEEEHSVVNDAESIMIDEDEYIAIDIYDNDYYAQEDKEEHVFALTDQPNFAHVNASCVHKLEEPLMLQLGMVGSYAMVQFDVDIKVRTLGTLTKEYVDIANFDCYDMIIGMPFMCKNNVMLDFVNNVVIVNRVPVRAEKVVLKDTDGCLQWYHVMEKGYDSENYK